MNDVVLVGHSFGGRVAIKFASRYSRLLEKVVLVDSAGIKPRRKIGYYLKVLRHKLLNLLEVPHTAGSADYRKLNGAMRQTFKNIVNEDLSLLVRKITLPVLLIWGDKDKETPIYMAKKLYKSLGNPALIIFRGAGHYSYLDRPDEFYMLLKSYLSEGTHALADIIGNNDFRNGILLKIPHALPEQ